jgi:hypothetical protein
MQASFGATRYDHQQERGFDFWVLRDPGQRVLRAPTELPRAARPAPATVYLQRFASSGDMILGHRGS